LPVAIVRKKQCQKYKFVYFDVVAVKNSVEAVQGNVHTLFKTFCDIFHCKSAKLIAAPAAMVKV
jgi:hypothetical protein